MYSYAISGSMQHLHNDQRGSCWNAIDPFIKPGLLLVHSAPIHEPNGTR